MIVQLMIYISLLLSALFLLSRYITNRKKPLNLQSSLSDKLWMGFFYGLIGVCLMYVHKALDGDLADPRQIVVLLSFFYGGWIPAIFSSIILIFFRFLIFSGPLWIFVSSLACTLVIAQIVVKSRIPRDKQWYLITIACMVEIYFFLLMYSDSLFNSQLFHFFMVFLLGSIFSYHFTESLIHQHQMTEQLVKSNEDLERSEAKYRLIAENSSDLIAVLSPDAKALYLSPSFFPVLGIDPEHAMDNRVSVVPHAEDFPLLREKWNELLSEKKPVQLQIRFQHANGKWLWIESYYMPVLTPNHDIDKIVVISRDITERKKTEDLLQDAEKLSMVGELAAGIAHEIRNPLTSLKGFVQLMQKQPLKPYYLEIMLEELNRIDHITNELLYLGKPQVQIYQYTNTSAFIEQTVKLMHPEALLHNITLNFEFEPDLPPILCVENQLKQVMINLLKNAIESMPNGGDIFIQVQKEDEQNLLIRIRDQGIGISPERIEKLGQPFYTLKEKGTGLGLTVCKKIIREHKGTLGFDSIVGSGTTVKIRLPI